MTTWTEPSVRQRGLHIAEFERGIRIVLHVRDFKPANNIFFGCDGGVLRLFVRPGTVGEAGNLCIEVRVAEECDGLSKRCDSFGVADLPGRRGYHSVQRRTKHIIAPSCKEIASVNDDRARLS